MKESSIIVALIVFFMAVAAFSVVQMARFLAAAIAIGLVAAQ